MHLPVARGPIKLHRAGCSTLLSSWQLSGYNRSFGSAAMGRAAGKSTSRGSVLFSVPSGQPLSVSSVVPLAVVLTSVGSSVRDDDVACSSCRRQCVPLTWTRRGMKSCKRARASQGSNRARLTSDTHGAVCVRTWRAHWGIQCPVAHGPAAHSAG